MLKNNKLTYAILIIALFIYSAKLVGFDEINSKNKSIEFDLKGKTNNINGEIRPDIGKGNNIITATTTDDASDAIAPAVSITSTYGDSGSTVSAATLRYSATLNYKATFDERVTGFDVDDITVTVTTAESTKNLSARSFVAFSDGKTYTFRVRKGRDDGIFTVSIAANVATGDDGSKNTASNIYTLTTNTAEPTVEISSTSGDSGSEVSATTLSYTATFSEVVTGFELSDITVSGTAGVTSATNFAGSDNVYTFDVVKGSSDGSVTVSIAAYVAEDSAGNDNTASNHYTLTIETTAPAVEITSTSGDSGSEVSAATLSYTATFDEDVTGFELSDITVTGTANGGSPVASNFQSTGASYTFDVVKGSSDGTVTVSIAANVAEDGAGNNNTASNDYTLTIDTTGVSVTITSTSGVSGSIVSAATLSYTATFDEDVTGFGANDITVSGTAGVTSATNFAGSDNVYTFDVVKGSSDGSVIVSIAAGVTMDDVNNNNTASNDYTLTIDTTVPTVIITSTSGDSDSTISAATLRYTATFNEDVTGFAVRDITVSGTAGITSATNFSGSGNVYIFDVLKAGSDGSVIVSIAADVAMDIVDNYNTVSNTHTLNIDTTPPASPVITELTKTIVSTASFTLSGTSSGEAGITIQLLRSGDKITGATEVISDGGDGTWSITLDLTIGANVITATATDIAGNISAASNSVTATLFEVTEQSSNIEGANSFGDVHFADSQTGWIAGESMFILHTTDGGVTWIEQPFPIKDGNVGGTNSVHFVDAMNGWVVGHNGTILHTTNGGVGATAEIVGHTANSNGERIIHNPAWNHQTSGVNTFLNSVHFVDAMNGWVVGNRGTILHTTNGGATWTSQTTDAVRNALAPGDPAITLESVHFVDAMNGWVVGHNGTILHTINGGTTWTAQTVDDSFTNHLQSVHFVDAMNGWAVGNRTGTSGTQDIIRTTDGGSTWVKSEFDSGVNVLLLNSLHFADAKNGFVVGNSFNFSPYAVRLVILHTTDGGKTWIPQNSIDPHTDPDVQKNLRSVYSIDANNAWAVGSGGTILQISNPSTSNPSTSNPVVSSKVNSVHSVDNNNAVAGGDGGTVVQSAIGDERSVKGISISPNPASDRIRVNNILEKTTYTLFDIRGRIVRKGVLTQRNNFVPVSSLDKGIYLLNLRVNKNSITRKVIKN